MVLPTERHLATADHGRWGRSYEEVQCSIRSCQKEKKSISLGTILVIILIIFLLGGFSGSFGGRGYGYGNRGIGLIGIILIILVVLLLTGRL